MDSAELSTQKFVEQARGSAPPEGSLPYYVKYAQETLIKLADAYGFALNELLPRGSLGLPIELPELKPQ